MQAYQTNGRGSNIGSDRSNKTKYDISFGGFCLAVVLQKASLEKKIAMKSKINNMGGVRSQVVVRTKKM